MAILKADLSSMTSGDDTRSSTGPRSGVAFVTSWTYISCFGLQYNAGELREAPVSQHEIVSTQHGDANESTWSSWTRLEPAGCKQAANESRCSRVGRKLDLVFGRCTVLSLHLGNSRAKWNRLIHKGRREHQKGKRSTLIALCGGGTVTLLPSLNTTAW
jgi:hypothetical protein